MTNVTEIDALTDELTQLNQKITPNIPMSYITFYEHCSSFSFQYM